MEVSNVTPFPTSELFTSALDASRAQHPTTMDDDMEIDVDVDMGVEEQAVILDMNSAGLNSLESKLEETPNQNLRASSTVSSTDSNQPVPNKVHIRGLDLLSTSDIKAFAKEHFPDYELQRVEWVDDTAANIVYDSHEVAVLALTALSAGTTEEKDSLSTLQLRQAKGFSTHPDTHLEVRMAVHSDRKQPGARERSRYYLFNPDQAPVERRKRERRRYRYDDQAGDYRRNRYDAAEHQRRRNKDEESGFDASLYDDDDAAVAARVARQLERNPSRSSFSSGDSRLRNSDRHVRFQAKAELFPDKLRTNGRGRLRDRSASPARDRDGDADMDHDIGNRRTLRERSYTPPPPYEERNSLKELFPSKAPESAPDPYGFSSASKANELFPSKLGPTNHRRADAFDAADETADLFAGRMTVPFLDGASEARLSSNRRTGGISITRSQDIEDRTSFPQVAEADTQGNSGPRSFSIRGTDGSREGQGFKIRGLAKDDTVDSKTNDLFPTKAGVKELFPTKLNSTKELFSEKLEGRGGRRRRAEDHF